MLPVSLWSPEISSLRLLERYNGEVGVTKIMYYYDYSSAVEVAVIFQDGTQSGFSLTDGMPFGVSRWPYTVGYSMEWSGLV